MKRITLCGSGKFKPLIHKVGRGLKERGFIVFVPPLHDMSFTQQLSLEQTLLAWKGATFAHLNRIEKGDICLLINPDGYLGVSSTFELGYAIAKRKLIVALRHDENEPG